MKNSDYLCFNIFFFLLFIAGCTSEKEPDIPDHIQHLTNLTVHPMDAEPEFSIQIEQDQNFGETEEVLIGSFIGNMAVDNSGRVYITDRSQGIHVYDADGTYLQRVGRDGAGPGEFQSPSSIRFTDDNLIVMDLSQPKVSLFDLESYAHIKDISLSIDDDAANVPAWMESTQEEGLTYQAIDYYGNSDGNVLVIFGHSGVGNLQNRNRRTWEISLLDLSEGRFLKHDILSVEDVIDVLALEEGGAITSILFLPKTQIEITANHYIYSNSNDMLFKFYDKDGDYSHAFYHPYSKVALTLNDAVDYMQNLLGDHDEIIDRVTSSILNSEIPQSWPVFNTFVVDDKNRLWIPTIIDDTEAYEWWVLDEDGELLASYTWPRDKVVKVVNDGMLYALETDEKTGLQQVVRYDIQITTN
ncbi:MAG: 6-bladed beta-propeller [Balneolales bacterium]